MQPDIFPPGINDSLYKGTDFKWADARKRYTAWFPRHKAVHQNTHWRLTLSCDADWPTKGRTAFWRQDLEVYRIEASQAGRHRFLAWTIPLSGGKEKTPSRISPGHSDTKVAKLSNLPTIKPWNPRRDCRLPRPHQIFRQLNHGALVTIADPRGTLPAKSLSVRQWFAATASIMLRLVNAHVRRTLWGARTHWTSDTLSRFCTHTHTHTSIIDPPLGGSMRVV